MQNTPGWASIRGCFLWFLHGRYPVPRQNVPARRICKGRRLSGIGFYAHSSSGSSRPTDKRINRSENPAASISSLEHIGCVMEAIDQKRVGPARRMTTFVLFANVAGPCNMDSRFISEDLCYVLAPMAHSISPPTCPLRPRGDRPFAGGSRVRPHPLLFSGRPCSALDKLERWAYNALN